MIAWLQIAADMPDDRVLGDVTRAAVLLFAGDAALFLVPVLVVAVIVGLVQTVMSITEASLSFLPKLAALVVVLAVAGDGVMRGLGDFLETGLLDMVGAIR